MTNKTEVTNYENANGFSRLNKKKNNDINTSLKIKYDSKVYTIPETLPVFLF